MFLLLLCSVMMCTNNRVHYDPMVVFVCLNIISTSLSSLGRPIWRYCISKILVSNILSRMCVCLRFSQFSWLSLMQYVGLCVFSLLISLMMIVRIHVLYLIMTKSEVWPVCHCLGLGHETMVCVVYPSIFLFKIKKPTVSCSRDIGIRIRCLPRISRWCWCS